MKVRPKPRLVLSAADRATAIQEAFAGQSGHVLELRAGGVVVNADRRAELLAAAVAREAVEIELDILAYEQETGKRNRNCFRFRDGSMMALGRSGTGTPFLRDHDKWSVEAIGGEVLKSETRKIDEGKYEVHQTVRLTEPAAVERALRGNLKAVSIGAFPTGPVLCSLCDTPVFEECWHWRGDEVEVDGQAVVVEWIYTSAELVETSEVPIGAVPRAGVQTIRAAFAAGMSNGNNDPEEGHQENDMKNRAAIVAKLKLAGLTLSEEATDAELEAALDELLADRAELAIANQEAAGQHASAADTFIREALASGRITPADEAPWRDLFGASPERARKRMEARAANIATPVGQARQSAAPDATDEQVEAAAGGTTVAAVKRDVTTKKVLSANGVDYDQAKKFAAIFGADDPAAALAKHAAGVEEN